ncbi:MAG TPA: 50S ribosomal protein L16 [archaeon]|jgi:large subunit ribosomal protein L10e|nr:50S ribosomal protein L16 [archaeon]HRT03326.1 50S ribosomal protein L16 [Candidatus Diapherotrites archaeon]
MGLRPGRCYDKDVKKRAYARYAKKVHKKNYVGGIPGSKIKQYHMGFGDQNYTHVLHLVSTKKIQIRDNAIEAARITVGRQLNKKLTQSNYYLKIRVHPQFYLRENKQAQGAHADRIQQGMSQCPFGKVIGSAVRVKPNQKIMSVLVNKENVDLVKKLLEKASPKFPCPMKVIVEENKDKLKSVGTVKKRKKLLAAQQAEDESIKAATTAKGSAAKSDTKSDTKATTKTDSKSGKEAAK